MLSCVCLVINHRWCQNVVSVGKKCMQGTAECVTGVLITFDVFWDLLLYRPQQHRIYLLNTIKCNVVYGDVICASFFQKIILTNQNVCIQPMIYNANRTEWSPIQSVIIWANDKIIRLWSRSLICQSYIWLDDTMSCYQLIKTMTKFEKEIRIGYTFSQKNTIVKLAICKTTAHARDSSESTYTDMMYELSL